MPPTASVTCRMPTRPSHRSVSCRSRVSSVRIASTGTSQSTSSSTVPSRSAARRVQFSNGVVVKYVDGRIRRRSSQTCTTTYVSVISSIRPHSSATTTTSSTRIASVNASCTPGEHVGQRALRRQAGDDREQARGRQEARAQRPRRRERQQDRRDRAEHQDRDGDAAQHLDLGADPARVPVVGDVDPVPLEGGVLQHEGEAADQPGHRDDERDQQDVLDGPRPVGRVGAQPQRDPDRDDEQDRAHRLARAAGEVGGDGGAAREPSHHHGEEGRGEEGDDDGDEERQRRDDEALDTVGHGRLDSAGQEVGAHVPQRRQCRT